MSGMRFLGNAMLALAMVGALARRGLADDDVLAYRVRPGDSLPLVAAEFYGDHQRTTIFVMAANKLTRQRKLVPGEKIWIPINRDITTSKGDTFESLAKTYLGDSDRAPLLAEFNGMAATDSLATGTPLVIPLRVTHTAARRETLAQISRKYFGDSKQAEMLRTYNHLAATHVDKDDTVIIPNLRVRIRADKLPKLDTEALARRAQREQTNADAVAALPLAHTAWLQADFAGVQQALSSVANRVDFLDADTAAEVGLLLGKAAIAFDDTPSAIALFRQVLSRQARELSAYFESPRVIAAWKRAGGKVRLDTEARD